MSRGNPAFFILTVKLPETGEIYPNEKKEENKMSMSNSIKTVQTITSKQTLLSKTTENASKLTDTFLDAVVNVIVHRYIVATEEKKD